MLPVSSAGVQEVIMVGVRVLEGIISGVASGLIVGLILAVFFWLTSHFQERRERRDQIQFLSTVIDNFSEQILNNKIRSPNGLNALPESSRDSYKKELFLEMYRQIDSTLQGRASQLTYDEIQDVRRVFQVYIEDPDFWLNAPAAYERIFDKARAIKWLKLSG